MSFPAEFEAGIDRLRGELHVWLLTPEETGRAERERWYETLSERERGRHARYLRESDRTLTLCAHGFVREVLSRYWPVPPQAWRFAENEHGRPEPLVDGASPLRFNLSHTPGLIAVVVHDRRDAGVDVEAMGRVADYMQVSRSVFARSERDSLLDLDVASRITRFYTYWTLKEAYIKARGMGLALPLREFAFDSDDPSSGIRFSSRIEDDPADWAFTSASLGTQHRVAVADRHRRTPPRGVRFLDRAGNSLDLHRLNNKVKDRGKVLT